MKYEDIIVPWDELLAIKTSLSTMHKKHIEALIDYLNIDKYKIIQWVMKTLNEDNAVGTINYLDWALSRIDWLIHTLSMYNKKEKDTSLLDWA